LHNEIRAACPEQTAIFSAARSALAIYDFLVGERATHEQ
jgi:hypothetical protein